MPILQANLQMPNHDVAIDTANPALLRVGAHVLPNGVQVLAHEFDLTPYQGVPFRLYVETDGRLTPALEGVHYWLLVEAILPERRMEQQETGQVDGNGQPIVEMVEVPLDLHHVDVFVRPWPIEEAV